MFDFIVNRKMKTVYGKNRQFQSSETKHTDDLLRLNAEKTDAFLRRKVAIRNPSYVRNRQYRTH